MTHKPPSLFDWNIVGPAIGDSFKKLDPRLMIKNPVMFVTMVGAVLTTVGIFTVAGRSRLHRATRRLALVHRAVRQLRRSRGRRPRQSPGRQLCARRARTRSPAACANGREEKVPAPELQKGDLVVCEAGDVIPADGEVIEGIASVDEAAITGESAPVIRESGGDRSAVTGGTRVISDRIVIRVTMEKGHGFLDRMIALVEGAKRQKTPNEIALTILLAALTFIFLLVCVTLKPFGIYSGVDVLRAGADRAAGLLDSHDHRRTAERHRHQRHGPRSSAATSWRRADAPSKPPATWTCCCSTRPAPSRSATAWPRRFSPRRASQPERLADAAQLASLADETPEGRSIVVLAKEKFNLRGREVAAAAREVCSVHRADPHERRGFSGDGRPAGPLASAKARRTRCASTWISWADSFRKPSARAWTRSPAPAARRWSSPKAAKCSAWFNSRTWSKAASRNASRSSARWASAP